MTTLSAYNQARLDRWLVHDPDRFERYLAAHPEVADFYENLNGLGDTIKTALSEAVDVPVDFLSRLWDRTTEQRDTGAAAVALDLLGLGVRTANVVLGDE